MNNFVYINEVGPRDGLQNQKKQKQYKMTKKDWMELLDFWPMTIVVPIMLVLILFGPWIMS